MNDLGQRAQERLTENVRHFVFEVLSGNEWVEQFLSSLDHGMDFTACTSQVGIIVESFPEVINRLVTGLRTRINEYTNLWLLVG